jgi:phage-related minor tail protein
MEIYERVEAVQHKVQDLTMQIEFYMRELDEIKQELMKSDLLVPGWIKERLKEERDV